MGIVLTEHKMVSTQLTMLFLTVLQSLHQAVFMAVPDTTSAFAGMV